MYTQINVDIPDDSRSPDEWENAPLAFRLQILKSESACGYGNVTLDGQELSQTLNGDISEGSSTFVINRKTLVASWSFHCVKVNGVADSQFMKFVIDLVDGKPLQDVCFSMLFRQSGSMEIMNIEKDLTIPDEIAANPKPEALQPIDQDVDLPLYSIEDDIAELHWMQAQLRELEYLIFEKEQAIRQHASHHFQEDIEECDSLKCIVKTVAEKARHAAHHLYGKIRGDFEEHDEEYDEFDHPHFKKPPFKKPHFPKPPFHGGKNHTWGPPKGNHTHPGKPHFPHHPLPICRYPPPPHHGKPPHGHPPGPPPASVHRPNFHHGPDMDEPHPPPHHIEGHHSRPEFDGPHHDEGHRPNFGKPHDEEGHHTPPPPDFEEGHHRPPPPHFDGPHHGEGHHGPPPPDFDGPPHDGDDHRPPPPPPEFQQEHMGPPGDRPHGHPPPFDGPHGPRRNGIGKAFQIIKFTAIGFLFAILIIALHRRNCTPKRRADRQARKERRRAYRRAVHKRAITRLLARLSGNDSDSEDDDEEKRQALLSDAEDGMSTTMTEDITQLRNAAELVGDMVTAEGSRSQAVAEPISIPATTEARPLIQGFETLSQVGDGEELPAYEDNDGSEASSFVADGFRYTPGSSDYSPSHSPAGSVSDILGPDTKS